MLSGLAAFTGNVLSGVADAVYRAVTGRKRSLHDGDGDDVAGRGDDLPSFPLRAPLRRGARGSSPDAALCPSPRPR
jgi:hypothetical protein